MPADDALFAPDDATLTAIRDRKLRATLDCVFRAHPFYRRRFERAGIAREDISGIADLGRLPVTSKSDFIAEPEAFRLALPADAPADERVVWDVMYTTGSTGEPAPFVSTSYDFLNILALNRAMLRLRGVNERDSILNLFPLTRHPHGAFTRAMQAAAAYNIPVTAAMPGRGDPRRPEIGNRLDEVVVIAQRARATILWGVPSYIRKLLDRAEQLGARLPDVRLVFVTGEAFGEDARADLVARLQRLGASEPRISISYGATEMQGGMVECRAGAGYHNPAPDQFYFEAVDPATHQPVGDGEEGLLLLTHLDRRGTVMLRYSLGDVARLTRARCRHCSALTERLISVPRRADGLVKIKGMLVNPQLLVDALMAEAAVAEFQAIVDKEVADDPLSMDQLRIRVAPSARADAAFVSRLAERVRAATGVTPLIEPTTGDDPLFAGGGWKATPLLDLRSPSR
jgi:phenylacetate-CoA ligase